MPPDGTIIKFHFARVHARADLYPEVADRRTDRLRTPDRASRTVEGREDAVARGVHVAAPVTFDLYTSALVVTREDGTPLGIAHRASFLGRANDVGEQHGGEHAVEICRRGCYPGDATDLSLRSTVVLFRPTLSRSLGARLPGSATQRIWIGRSRSLDPNVRISVGTCTAGSTLRTSDSYQICARVRATSGVQAFRLALAMKAATGPAARCLERPLLDQRSAVREGAPQHRCHGARPPCPQAFGPTGNREPRRTAGPVPPIPSSARAPAWKPRAARSEPPTRRRPQG